MKVAAAPINPFSPSHNTSPHNPIEEMKPIIPTAINALRPRLSDSLAHFGAVITHNNADHTQATHFLLTGQPPPRSIDLRTQWPHMGSVLAKLAPGNGPLPPFAIVPHRMDVAGGRRAGQFAGALGPKYDPLLTGGNPNDDAFKLDHLPLSANESPAVVKRRLSLVDQLNAEASDLNALAMSGSIKDSQLKAVEVISSDAVRKAVDLSAVEGKERERYGRNLFGQSVMLGRRLLDVRRVMRRVVLLIDVVRTHFVQCCGIARWMHSMSFSSGSARPSG